MPHYFIAEKMLIHFRRCLTSGMIMSDQRWRSCCTLSDGKHNNNNTSNIKARSKKSTQSVNIKANILIIGHRHAWLLYRRKCRCISVVFRECVWVINVEGHAANCRMASTTIPTRVIKRQDRRTQHGTRIYTWSQNVRASPVRRSDFLQTARA